MSRSAFKLIQLLFATLIETDLQAVIKSQFSLTSNFAFQFAFCEANSNFWHFKLATLKFEHR